MSDKRDDQFADLPPELRDTLNKVPDHLKTGIKVELTSTKDELVIDVTDLTAEECVYLEQLLDDIDGPGSVADAISMSYHRIFG